MASVFVMLVAAAAGTAQAVPLQQQFDQATALFEHQQWREAASAFGALERRLAGSRSARSLAIVRVREGVALSHLPRAEGAVEKLQGGLRDLPADDASLAVDRFDGWMALGDAQAATFDYRGAFASYRTAEAAAVDDVGRLRAIGGEMRSIATIDPKEALSASDRAQASLARLPGGEGAKETKGHLEALRGRALLNDGQISAARQMLLTALGHLGGLTMRVDGSDFALRSDLAIAALLAGDAQSAKQYLAYAGSGTLENGFAQGVDMDPPDCTGAPGLRPQDVAVVEFGIGTDGAAGYALPVYASAPGPEAAEFARAVSRWSWAPETLAKMPPLFRALARVQLRCSNAHQQQIAPALLYSALRTWFANERLEDPQMTGVQAADIAAERAELDRRARATGQNAPGLAPVLLAIAQNGVASADERRAAANRLRDIVLATQPPEIVRAAVQLLPILDATSFENRRQSLAAADQATTLLADPAIARDARALDALRLRLADFYLGLRRTDAAAALVEAIVTDQRLAERDIIRVAALVRQSALMLAAGNAAGARTAYERTGLTAAQCSLVDAAPAHVRGRGSENDYPQDAISWRISGWAQTEFDIDAQGKTANVRAVIAYPPFVFDKPTERIYQRMQFTQTYRPGGGLGCQAYRATQAYRVVGP